MLIELGYLAVYAIETVFTIKYGINNRSRTSFFMSLPALIQIDIFHKIKLFSINPSVFSVTSNDTLGDLYSTLFNNKTIVYSCILSQIQRNYYVRYQTMYRSISESNCIIHLQNYESYKLLSGYDLCQWRFFIKFVYLI